MKMACERFTVTTNNNNTNTSFIYKTIARIDQLQKEANVENVCEGCEGSLMARIFNTKPVSFYLCNGTIFTVNIPTPAQETGAPAETNLFRIENVYPDAVVLRLLYADGAETICTNRTVILSLDCICCMQCFDPICCDPCNKSCGQ